MRIPPLFSLFFYYFCLASSAAAIEVETYAYLKNETAIFTRSGAVIGQHNKHSGTAEPQHRSGDFSKLEFSANLFLNSELTENLSGHMQLNFVYYDEGEHDNLKKHHTLYSQQDYVREAYIDYTLGENTDIRLGKQQVVWGTADGVKLLDKLNPTDYREFFQNTPEEARIPVWMAKLEQSIGDTGNLQLLAVQAVPNRIPGLQAGGEAGQAFMTRGVDAITGPVNGFTHITPALGNTAFAFGQFAAAFTGGLSGKLESVGGNTFTVQDFINGSSPFCPGGKPVADAGILATINSCAKFLDFVAQTPGLGGNENVTNLVEAEFDASQPDNTFEYLAQASFSTFDSFSQAQTRYRRKYPNDEQMNFGLRYQGNWQDQVNYSLNYLYHYDANPIVNVHWEDPQGQRLQSFITDQQGVTGDTVRTVRLRKDDGSVFNARDPLAENDGVATLVFEESLQRIHSIGGSFDTQVDSKRFGSIILRGEMVYEHGVKTPVINRDALAIGDMAQGLSTVSADFFKYAVGADITLLTNLTVGLQWIQFINLDYIDEAGNGYAQGANQGRYTAAQSTMHLTNNLKKADKMENFISVFLSKPFGESQRGRVNNLFLYKNDGGNWNRLNLEYVFSDQLLGTVEWNHYFGNSNSLFGQLHQASNFQLGIQYLME